MDYGKVRLGQRIFLGQTPFNFGTTPGISNRGLLYAVRPHDFDQKARAFVRRALGVVFLTLIHFHPFTLDAFIPLCSSVRYSKYVEPKRLAKNYHLYNS